MRTPAQALEALRALPCGARALEVLQRTTGGWVVGGAVRDALLGTPPREIDLVVEGDPGPVARALGGSSCSTTASGPTTSSAAAARSTSCAPARSPTRRPERCPTCAPGRSTTISRARDFTVNALALSPAGELRAVPGALDDLAARRLRVLHDASFADDPTRLWRLVRYAVRLGFVPEPATDRLAAAAVADGAWPR